VLVAIDRQGAVYAADTADVIVAAADGAADLDEKVATVLPLVRAGQARVLVAVPFPQALGPSRRRFAQLGWAVAAGPGIASNSLLTSPTTRTLGLIANVDLAPTILAWHQTPVPPGFAGRVMRGVPVSGDPWVRLLRLDHRVTVVRDAAAPVLIGYGIFAIGTGLLALVVLVRLAGGKGQQTWVAASATSANRLLHVFRLGLLTAAAALIAFLLLGLWTPASVFIYGLAVAVVSVLIALMAEQLGHRCLFYNAPSAPLGLVLCAAALLVSGDALFGSPLLARSLLSDFLAGFRFYGVGNEYMGLTVGAAVVGPLLLRRLPSSPTLSVGEVVLWLFTCLAIGAPFFGADAGGAVTSAVTFLIAAFALRAGQTRPRHVAAAFALAAALLAVFALLDRVRPVGARTHTGAAVAAGQARGASALWEIVAGKAATNAAVLLTPGTFLALAGLAPIWWLLARGPLAAPTQRALARRPVLRLVLPAAVWGAVTGFLTNDSGIVVTFLLLAPPTGAVVDALLCDFLALITAPGGSDLP
jgi:hypothetical protein